MQSSLLSPIKKTLCETQEGTIEIAHPNLSELEYVIAFLNKENLDVRRLQQTAQESYKPMPIHTLHKLWDEKIHEFSNNFSNQNEIVVEIKTQLQDILNFLPYPKNHQSIQDAFNMKIVEKTNINTLKTNQLTNSIIAKHGNKIVGFGRLLEVEDSIELVSLWTHPEWRKLGIAGKIIDLLLQHANNFPIFSFQELTHIPYYLKTYRKNKNAHIVPFRFIPLALQRDLVYMNFFWGPYTIIKID